MWRKGKVTPMPGRTARPLEERFWESVDVREWDECWLWCGGTLRDGKYGQMKTRGKMVYVHRVSFALNIAPIPPTLVVRHTCDTPLCVNPLHLILGTHQDNVDDRTDRDRHRALRGAALPQAILDEAKVKLIRDRCAAGETHELVARSFGVARQTITAIVLRVTWRSTP